MELLLTDIVSELNYYGINYEILPDETFRQWNNNTNVYVNRSTRLKESHEIISEFLTHKPQNSNKIIFMIHYVEGNEYYIYFDYE